MDMIRDHLACNLRLASLNLRSNSQLLLSPARRTTLLSSRQAASKPKMKRKAFDDISKPRPKQHRVREPEPDYCDAVPQKDANGIVWPAPEEAMEKARVFIRDW